MKAEAAALVLETLRFDRSSGSVIPPSGTDWAAVLAYCDRYQLTLAFARKIGACPQWVRERLDGNAAANRIRHAKVLELYRDLCHRLAGIEHLVLKGFTHFPYFCGDPGLRTHYDLDVYCMRESLPAARDALLSLGFEPLHGVEAFPTDHLPPMIRKTGWQWRDDFFDTELPIAVELHFRFWDRDTERFGPVDSHGFWERREVRQWGDLRFPALQEADALAYASLHAMRHLLRGDPRPSHFFEIGYFLERQQDPEFWERWRQLHDPGLRRIQAICFRFAQTWFECRVPAAALHEVEELPQAVQSWFERWGRSPLEAPFRPNKDELWLHLSLLESIGDQAAVLRRRLVPLKPPGPVDAVHVPREQMTLALHVRKQWRYVQFTTGRVLHHARVLLPTAINGLRWFFTQRGLSEEFWRFFRSFVIFNAGLMVFHLLYNLYLMSRGFQEDFIGKVSSAMTVGSLLGSFVAGLVVSRFGLRPSLFFCFLSQGATSALRVFASTPVPLLGFAFLAGISHSFWAVCLAPTVAMLTSERSRPFAFSLTFSMGIGLGMVAGVVGGRLPALLHSTQNALWVGCALAPLAVLPLLRLPLGVPSGLGLRSFVVNPFLIRLLVPLALWGLATGSFNPFFNVFLAGPMHFSVEKIGLLFTASQMAQVCAMLLSPLVLRRCGLISGIAWMQVATALAMGGLALTTPMLAALLYPLYMAFQYMSEPGIFSLLMKAVPESQRTAASALNFIVAFAMQALSAWLAGAAIQKFGYPPVLLAAAALALVAAAAITRITEPR